MEFSEIVKQRYATKSFDGKTVPKEKVDELLEMIRLSASSFNLQPWKIKIIEDKTTKEKLVPASWNQPQITSCSHLLVFCADTDVKNHIDKLEAIMDTGTSAYVEMMRNFESTMPDDKKLSWAQRQVYLAVGNAINGAKSLGFDSCPMEGFNAEAYAKILDLPKNLIPTAIVPIGYATDTPRPKIRFDKKDVFI
ncbi:MAG: NAD(P)H-dependent oxidoreductase [Candidatus Woesearchaeota archaeon]